MLKLNEKEKLELIFSHFQFFNRQIIRTFFKLAPNRYGLVKGAKPY